MENEQDDVIVDTEADYNEEVEEATEAPAKAEKPKRTPQEELEYFEGRASRLRKKLGIDEAKATDTTKATQTDKPNDLDYGQLALLRTEGIKGSGELALFKEIMAETGKGVLDVMDSGYFKSRLAEFRESQESAAAVPKGKGRSGQTGVTDVDMAVAKYKESGTLPDDFRTRSAVVKHIAKEEHDNGVFSGPSVIGPVGQTF
jgi:hypothetical protein